LISNSVLMTTRNPANQMVCGASCCHQSTQPGTSGVAACAQILVEQLVVAIGNRLRGWIDLTAAGALDLTLGATGIHLVQLSPERLARLTGWQRARTRITTRARTT
jgi:hypothetical protein